MALLATPVLAEEIQLGEGDGDGIRPARDRRPLLTDEPDWDPVNP